MRDHSIDLETLSSEGDAAIIAIGVQEFDLESGKLGRKLYRNIELSSAIKSGRVSADTLTWWMSQSDEARKLFHADVKYAVATALDELATFMRATKGGVPRVWGYGSSFDISILEWNYRHSAIALAIPWNHRNVFDIRTIVDAARLLVGFDPHVVVFEGTPHNAQDDATNQAKLASAAYDAIRKMIPKEHRAIKTVAFKPGFSYWKEPTDGSMIKLRLDEAPRASLGYVEVDEASYKKWDDEQL